MSRVLQLTPEQVQEQFNAKASKTCVMGFLLDLFGPIEVDGIKQNCARFGKLQQLLISAEDDLDPDPPSENRSSYCPSFKLEINVLPPTNMEPARGSRMHDCPLEKGLTKHQMPKPHFARASAGETPRQ